MWALPTADMWLLRGGAEELPFGIALEILAQGALVAFADPADADGPGPVARGLLAGIDEAELHAPIVPGDELRIEVEVLGRFGPLLKARASLVDDSGRPRASASLLLAKDPA